MPNQPDKTDSQVDKPLGSRVYRLWLMVLLVAIYASSSLDRLVLATIAPALKADLGISDLQFGLLSGFFFAILFTLGGIPLARLADRRRRVPILAAAAALWSVMTALSAFAAGFAQIAICRIGLGLGEAGCAPIAYSLLSDQYPRRSRASVIAILGLGIPLGSVMGSLLGGWTSEHGGWRHAFLWAGLPGIALALLALLTLREPPRGIFDPRTSSGGVPTFGAVLRMMWAKPACRHMVATATLCLFGINGVNLFLPSFFVRVHGLVPFEAGKYFGLLMGVAATIGTTGLGLLIGRLGRRDSRWYGWGPAAIMLLGTPLYLLAFMAADFSHAYPLLFVSTCIGFAFLAPMVGAVHNMVEPRMRASASAVLGIAMQLVGASAGTAFTGWASDRLARHAFAGDYALACPAGLAPKGASQALAAACHQAAATGLRQALIACATVFLWAALHSLLAARTLRRDLEHSSVAVAPHSPEADEALA